MRIVFMGTPQFAVPVLEGLSATDYHIAGVVTQPDRPAGRGKKVEPTPVKHFALDSGLKVLQPPTLDSPSVVTELQKLDPDLIVVAAYGSFLPPQVLNLPEYNCLNIHPSMLPNYRGPSPVASAILNGDNHTGSTVRVLDSGMDSGPLVAQQEEKIDDADTTQILTNRLFNIGTKLLIDILPQWIQNEIKATPQQEANATFTKLLTRQDGQIAWSQTAQLIERQIRAYSPWPGSFTSWKGRLKILKAHAVSHDTSPGLVIELDNTFAIGTGQGVLKVTELQLEGRKAVNGTEFLQGHRDIIGEILI